MGRLEKDVEIKALEIMADQVHMFISFDPRQPLHELIKAFKGRKDGNKGLTDRYLAFISTFPNLGLREIDQNVAHQAAKLRARYGFKTPDALFLATAMEEKAEAFITNDVRLQGIENIEIVLLKDFA